MVLDSLVDTVLKGVKRSQELRKERQFEYAQWMDEVESELEVFLNRTKKLNADNRDDREEFYNHANQLKNRLEGLRERSTVAEAPAAAIIELEDLIEILKDTNRGGVFYTSMNPSEEEIARNEQKSEERASEDVERVLKQIEQFTENFESEAEDS